MSIEMEQEVKKWEQKKVLFSYKAAKMKIAICDESTALIKEIKTMLYRYADKMRLEMVADCYLSGEKMLLSEEKYSIIFLGYKLAGSNGLEIAKSLRKTNDFSAIIFVSGYTDFVFEAFKVSPFRFLVSPVSETELFSALNEFFEQYGSSYPIWIKSREDTVCLNTRDILYLEADNKHCIIHVSQESYRCNKTMAKVSNILPRDRFIKINRAYIINCEHIKKYNSDVAVLKTGEELHISRKYLHSFKSEYQAFLNPRKP